MLLKKRESKTIINVSATWLVSHDYSEAEITAGSICDGGRYVNELAIDLVFSLIYTIYAYFYLFEWRIESTPEPEVDTLYTTSS